MTLTFAELFANPDHYLFAFEGDDALFRPMDRAAYQRSIFLDARISPAGEGVLKIPIGALLDLLASAKPEPREIGWIFHIAHCGSTLLARGLDQADTSLVLREPMALRQLAVDGAGGVSGDWRDGLRLVATMLGRRYADRAPVIVKANVPVNFVLGEVMALRPDAGAILLHFALDDYLVAILRSADHRAWLRRVTTQLAAGIEAAAGPIAGLGDAELAAALWLAQMRIFAAALDRWPRLRSLDAERLLTNPIAVLTAACRYFDLPVPDDLDALTSAYSKNPGVAFDNSARLDRRAEAKRALADERTQARAWVERRRSDFPLPERLPRPLSGDGVPLLG